MCKLLLSHKNVKKYTLLFIRSIALSLNSIVVCDTKCRYTTLYLTHLTQFQHSSSCQYFLFSIYHYFPFFTWVYLKPEGRGVPVHFCNFIISSLLIGQLSSFHKYDVLLTAGRKVKFVCYKDKMREIINWKTAFGLGLVLVHLIKLELYPWKFSMEVVLAVLYKVYLVRRVILFVNAVQ